MQDLVQLVKNIEPLRVYGRVAVVNGLLIEAKGGLSYMQVGARCEIMRRGHEDPLPVEVVGFREDRALMMPFGPVEGVTPGAEIRISAATRRQVSIPRPNGWGGSSTVLRSSPIDGHGPPAPGHRRAIC